MKLRYFATTNDHKLQEVNHILGFDLEKIHLELTEPQNMDVELIAKAKALEAFRKIGEPVLVEDTAWFFEAWHGLPGPFAKFFVETVGCEGILKMLGAERNRGATAKTVVACHDGDEVHVFIGELAGTIPLEPRGESGFGFDPIFIPDGHTKTFAEMDKAEKNALSMRALAVQKLKSFLENKS